MPKTDDISQRGISIGPSGHIVVRYINSDGEFVILDLTAEIERIALEEVKKHQLNYHGG